MNRYDQMYVDYLHQTINVDGKQYPVARYPSQYSNITSTHKDSCVDVIDRVSDVYVWSDQHFGHNNIIKYSNRPYGDKYQMTTDMVDNHNSVVGKDDICVYVGDVAFMGDGLANEILQQLNGYKILIVGNHDMHKKKLKKLNVDEVHLTYYCEYNHTQLLFTHYPISDVPSPIINIHGHTHDREDQSIQHINVSVERINYTPVSLQSLIEQATQRVNTLLK